MNKEITALKFHPRKRDRVDIYLEGKRAFQIAKSIALRLQVGQTLSGAEIDDLLHRDEVEKFYQQALRLISRRPRSEYEIQDRIRRKGGSEETQEKVIGRLRELGLADDRAFAEAWIEDRLSFRPRSAWALRYELRRKGLGEAVIDEALEGFDDEEAAYLAALKGARRMKDYPWEKFRQRLGSYLKRRGFPYPMISPVVERVWREVTGPVEESEVKK
jgi:regulatory protein